VSDVTQTQTIKINNREFELVQPLLDGWGDWKVPGCRAKLWIACDNTLDPAVTLAGGWKHLLLAGFCEHGLQVSGWNLARIYQSDFRMTYVGEPAMRLCELIQGNTSDDGVDLKPAAQWLVDQMDQ